MNKQNSYFGFMLVCIFLVASFWIGVNQNQKNKDLEQQFAQYKTDQQKKIDDLQKNAMKPQPKPQPKKISVNGHSFYQHSDPTLVVIEALLALHDPKVDAVLQKFDVKVVDLDQKQQFPVAK